MKKLKWIVMALVLVLGMAAFAACTPDEPETPVFTVTYYDGTTVLKTEEVEGGGYATYWEPEDKDGMEFSDWYVDAGLNRVFDFETEAITADRNLYAGYVTVGSDDTLHLGDRGQRAGRHPLVERLGHGHHRRPHAGKDGG